MFFWFMGRVVAKTKTPTCISNDLKPGLNGVSRRRKLKLGSWVPVEPSLRGRPYKSRSPSSRARFFPSPSPSTPVTQATLSQVLRALTFTLSCLALTCALPWNEIVYPVQGNLPVWPPNTKTRRGRPFYFLFFAGTRSSSSFNLSNKIAIKHAIKHRFDMYMYSLINSAHLLPSNYTSEHHKRTVGFLFLLIL